MTTDFRTPYSSDAGDDAAIANDQSNTQNAQANGNGSSGAIAESVIGSTRTRRNNALGHSLEGNSLDSDRGGRYRNAQRGQNGERYAPEKIRVTANSHSGLLQAFYDLPVADKQLAGLLVSKILSVAGVIGLSLLLLSVTGRRQLLEQAASELSATTTDLTGDASVANGPLLTNDALLEAADFYDETEQVDEQLAEEARGVLTSVLQSGGLEYMTLVGTDMRVIVSGGADREGNLFNPNNLVSAALRKGQPNTATSLVALPDLQTLGITIPAGIDEAALVRFAVTPIFSNSNAEEDAVARGEVIGALVTGDIIDGNSAVVTEALNQFPKGYSAIYQRDPSGGFARVSLGNSGAAGSEPDVAQHQFLTDAIETAPGEIVSERFVGPNGDRYTVAATPLLDGTSEPVAVVLRGLSERTISDRLFRNGWLVTGAAMLALLADVIIAKLLGRSIVKPVRNLQVATERFASGDRSARADVYSRDEVGRVASAFNELAAAVSSSESSLRFQTETQTESARRARLLNEFTSQVRQSLDVDSILGTTVGRVRSLLEVDRVIIYRFNAGYGGGDVTAESVGKGWTRALGQTLEDPMMPKSVDRFKTGQISYVQDIDKEDLTECHCRLLKELEVKANMVAPVIVGDDLVGLICAHQCSGPRHWQPEEISMMQQIATQVGYALAQSRILQTQKQAVKREQQLTSLVTSIREAGDRDKIFRIVTRQVKLAIDASRVIVYTFDAQWNGTIVAESVDPQWPPSLGSEITDPCFAEQYVEKYKTGRVKAIPDIYKAGLTSCYMGQLEPFKVRANLVAPIVVEGRLLGLLIAHECAGPRDWSELTINFIQRAATQLGYALEQAEANEQKMQALSQTQALSAERLNRQEALENQLVNLLGDVEAAADGDLTVRADVTASEIGTVADFFNAIVENLRQVVTQVKQSANQVNASLGENESSIRLLAAEALQQAEQTTLTLNSVDEMTTSIQQVAEQAQEAAAVARTASKTATAGEEAMDLTVSNIMAMRQTVGQTAKKVKRLGESSQQITKAVMLINQIAQQTNLLAINAGIEAARAGEAGQGFAAVAEEVGELATRSSSATEEIERIVETIQRETNDVVEAIEQSTTQVVEGTRRVEDAKASLNQILAGSQRMDELAAMISQATGLQVETSTTVSTLMAEIAQLSKRTSASSRQVSEALKQTVSVAQNLQNQVATFVVEESPQKRSQQG